MIVIGLGGVLVAVGAVTLFDAQLPSLHTITTKLNALGYHLGKVRKCLPQKNEDGKANRSNCSSSCRR